MTRRLVALLALLVIALALVSPTSAQGATSTLEYCAHGSPSGLLALRPTPDVNTRALLTLADGDCGVFVASNAARSKQFVRATVDGQRGWVVAAWIVRAPEKSKSPALRSRTECGITAPVPVTFARMPPWAPTGDDVPGEDSIFCAVQFRVSRTGPWMTFRSYSVIDMWDSQVHAVVSASAEIERDRLTAAGHNITEVTYRRNVGNWAVVSGTLEDGGTFYARIQGRGANGIFGTCTVEIESQPGQLVGISSVAPFTCR